MVRYACRNFSATLPVSEKFKVLHGFNAALTIIFSFWAHFHAAKAAQKPRFPLQFLAPHSGVCGISTSIACANQTASALSFL
jgi:hypothetical protein